MYRGFNIEVSESDKMSFQNKHNEYINEGNRLFNHQSRQFYESIKTFVGSDGVIDATKVIDGWFPRIKADVFISHSHADKDFVLFLAGFLYKECGLVCFVDSLVWGYANDLLKEIDTNYCTNGSSNSFNYNKRNYSTSHVHMMLSTALNDMIDECECLFFINTPQSIVTKDDINNKTSSCWIYSEIQTSKIIRKNTPDRLIPRVKLFSEKHKNGVPLLESTDPELQFIYKIGLSHLKEIEGVEFFQWLQKIVELNINGIKVLDNLYQSYQLDKIKILNG